MARISNPAYEPVALPTGHVVPGNGHLDTTNAVLRCPDNVPFLRGQSISGALTVEYDPDPAPQPETPGPSITAPEATHLPPTAPEKRKAKE